MANVVNSKPLQESKEDDPRPGTLPRAIERVEKRIREKWTGFHNRME